jgi:hypothetical protein
MSESRSIRAHVEGCPKNLSVPVDLCSCGGRDFKPGEPSAPLASPLERGIKANPYPDPSALASPREGLLMAEAEYVAGLAGGLDDAGMRDEAGNLRMTARRLREAAQSLESATRLVEKWRGPAAEDAIQRGYSETGFYDAIVRE